MLSTLGDLARLVSGALDGDDAIEIHGASPLSDAGRGEITMIDAPQRSDEFSSTGAAAAVVPPGTPRCQIPTVTVESPHEAFEKIVKFFRPAMDGGPQGIDRSAIISESAEIASTASIGPLAVIGDQVLIGHRAVIHAGVRIAAGCRIGESATIFPSAVLYANTHVGDRAIIHSGAIVGAHGFGYRQENGRHIPCGQLGRVEICNDVEIGANTTIDRGTYGATIIGEGTKIDNLVQIAHNCRIGRHNMICSQVGIAGSTTTGDYVVMAGQVGVRDHVHIDDRAVISAMAGITNDVPAGAVMMGIPATPEREQKLKQAALAKLAEMRKEFKAVKRALARIAVESSSSDEDPSLDLPRVSVEKKHGSKEQEEAA